MRKDPIIKFVSTSPQLTKLPETNPQPTSKFIPEWFKKTKTKPTQHGLGEIIVGNFKTCPSFPDYFSQGYIIPMWADVILKFDSESQSYFWRTANEEYKWSSHAKSQFLDDVNFSYFGKEAKFVFKPECPWKIITKPGWSVYQLPVFYHFDSQFTVLPGVIDTDIHHTINQQVIVFDEDKEIFIKKGTPFVQYIPFKRQKTTMSVVEMGEKEAKKIRLNHLKITNELGGSNQYLKMRKERDQ